MKNLLLVFFACLMFLHIDVFAACSIYEPKATLNEIYLKDQGNAAQKRGYIEVKLLDESIPDTIYNTWNVEICAASGCEILSLSDAQDTNDFPWIFFDKNDFDIFKIDFVGGFDLSVTDADGDFIDYIQVNGFSHQTVSCNKDEFSYVFTTPTTTNGTKLLHRIPDGTGAWLAVSANPTETPGRPNHDLTDFPFLAISDVSVEQGEVASFTVSIVDKDGNPATSSEDIEFYYKTIDDTALSPTHYNQVTRSLGSIPNGFNSITIPVTTVLIGDDVTREFLMFLDGSSDASIYDGLAIGEITPATAQIEQFLIVHDGEGLTCLPEPVLIRACSDASCSSFDDTINTTVTMQVNGGADQSIDIINGTSVNESFVYTDPITPAVLSLTSDYLCSDIGDNSDSCAVNFAEAGFLLNLDNHQSCTTPKLTIKAVRISDSKLDCEPAYTGNQSVDFVFNYVNPSSGYVLPTLDGTSMVEAAPQSKIVYFDSTGTAELDFNYQDAGQIKIEAIDSASAGLTSSSVITVVSPAKLIVSTPDEFADCDDGDGSCSDFTSAGTEFNLDVTAVCGDSTVTKNFEMDNIELTVNTVAPKAGNDVSLGVTIINIVKDDNGSHRINNQTISEVGVFTITAIPPENGYFGMTILEATSANIGRFIPEYFEQTVVVAGSLDAVCNQNMPFAYIGQTLVDDDTKGAISYLLNPVVELTAMSALDTITKNYTETGFMKLVAADDFITPPTTDSTITGEDTDLLPLTANLFAGTVSHDDLVAADGSSLASGVLHYELSDEDNFVYIRNENSEINAQYNDINFVIDQINFTDSDGVAIATPVDIMETTGINLRFGRAYLENSFGPETSDLPQPFSVQYLNSLGKFVVNDLDTCTNFDSSEIDLTDGTLEAAKTGVNVVNGQLESGETRAMILTAPGAGNQGTVNVEYDIYDWLKYDWDWNGVDAKEFDENPSAVATFGLFRGNDRIIYQREVNN